MRADTLSNVVDADWQRLGRRIRAERNARWPRREDFAHACGVSARVIAALENAERDNISEAILDAVEYTLGWPPGSFERVRKGLSVDPPDPDFARVRAAWPRLSGAGRRSVADVAENLARKRGNNR